MRKIETIEQIIYFYNDYFYNDLCNFIKENIQLKKIIRENVLNFFYKSSKKI